jgi:uncharacterized protein YidB (DUF937 family)
MNDLFGKMIEMLGQKKPSERAPAGLPANLDLGKILGGLMGKDGSGLSSILRKMVASGLGSIVKSWIARGPNKLISGDEIRSSIGDAELDRLAAENGITRDQLTNLLAEHLPDAVDQMTPDGELRAEGGTIMDLTPLNER